MRKMGFILLLVVFSVLFNNCSSDEILNPKKEADYFPVNPKIVWTYSSNVLASAEDQSNQFEMKVDSFEFPNGKFLALLGKFPQENEWHYILAVKDSGGIVYSLGDNPPEEPVPLFKHNYNDNEGQFEVINISGKNYNTLKIEIPVNDSVTINWWFADGIGLVKEESFYGASIFTDEHWNEEYHSLTELVDYKVLE